MTRNFHRLARLRILMLAMAFWAVPAEAYYHYVYYPSGAPYTPLFVKFDLNALPNKTVTFLVDDTGPATLAQNDGFSSVLSQVRQAALVWNSVPGSDLRVAFGGVKAAKQASNSPGADVVFADLPPGTLGMSALTLPTTPTETKGPNGPFIALTRSTVMLTNNTSQPPGPSYLESFFTTAVHEMGHALGLQHTFTGSAMSIAKIRSTSRTRPIDTDDIAGLNLLYGNAAYAATVGSIAGTVTSNGQGVALASVVAITAAGPAVSTLTNPDGTYRIDGLPPGRYWVYVHPLPPDADMTGPFDGSGKAIPGSGPVETLFYPGTRDPDQFGIVSVAAGAAVTGIDFSVAARDTVPAYDLATYSYDSTGQYSVTPAFVNSNLGANTIAVQAVSPATSTPVPQFVTAPSYSDAAIQPYGAPVALGLYFASPLVASSGPRHILFVFGDDMYVLPGGLVLVQNGPPSITSVTPNGDGTVTVTGTNFAADSRVFFDGLPAAVTAPFTGDNTNGAITVNPPPGRSGQIASIIVYNSDGQNSTFYQTQAPPTYTYPTAATPQITVSPAALPAGASSLVDITGSNTSFAAGQVTLGLGTFDIAVGRVWVLSPTHLIANVAVAPAAAPGVSEASVISGFQTAFHPLAFQIQAANPSQPSVQTVVNANVYQPGFYPGASVSLNGSNLAVPGTSPLVSLNDKPIPVVSASAGQVSLVIPASFPTGLAILKVSVGTANAFPIAVQIDNPPPVIAGIVNAQNQALGASQPASNGDTVFLTLPTADSSLVGSPGRIHVTVGGVDMPVLQVAAGAASGTVQVAFQITQSFDGSAVPVVISVDGAASDPYSISVN